jgi:hypothetical protein
VTEAAEPPTAAAAGASQMPQFQQDLCDYVKKILTVDPRVQSSVDSNKLFRSWGSILSGQELDWNSVPRGVHLLASVPGGYRMDDDRYGHHRLRSLLAKNLPTLSAEEKVLRPIRVEVQVSSLGVLRKDFYTSFWRTLCTEHNPKYSGSHKPTAQQSQDSRLSRVWKQMQVYKDQKSAQPPLLLDSGFSVQERQQCHRYAEVLGLKSQSTGRGEERRLCIWRVLEGPPAIIAESKGQRKLGKSQPKEANDHVRKVMFEGVSYMLDDDHDPPVVIEETNEEEVGRWVDGEVEWDNDTAQQIHYTCCDSIMRPSSSMKAVHKGTDSAHTSDTSANPDIRIVWPTFDTVAKCVLSLPDQNDIRAENSEELGASSGQRRARTGLLMTMAEHQAGMTAESEDWSRDWYPRDHFWDNLPPWTHRQSTLHHSKVIASTVDNPQAESTQNSRHASVPTGLDSTRLGGHTLCRWVYLGSHNLSGAAWGVREGGPRFSTACYRCIAWELGVVIIPSKPALFPLPFTSNYKKYNLSGSTTEPPDVPWGPTHIRERIAGSGGAETAARMDVARSAMALKDCCDGDAHFFNMAPVTVLKDKTFGELVWTHRAGASAAGAAAATVTAPVQRLPRLLLFIDLQVVGSEKTEHDDAFVALWRSLCQLGPLTNKRFGGLWVGGVDKSGRHCGLVAHDMGIANSVPPHDAAGCSQRRQQLPAVRVIFGSHTLFELDGVDAVAKFAQQNPTSAAAQLTEAAGRIAVLTAVDNATAVERQIRQKQFKLMLLTNANWIRKQYKAIVFDTEGCIKKPTVKTLAAGKKFDSFYSWCVPFFAALLLPEAEFEATLVKHEDHLQSAGSNCSNKKATIVRHPVSDAAFLAPIMSSPDVCSFCRMRLCCALFRTWGSSKPTSSGHHLPVALPNDRRCVSVDLPGQLSPQPWFD